MAAERHSSPVAGKDASIQTLRGVAIILMVAGHVIGDDATRGLQVGDDSVWRYGYSALEDLRLPLFTVLSGLVYALRPVREAAAMPAFLRGKVQRLLVPLVCVGLLLFSLQLVVPGTNSKPEPGDVWRIVVYSFEHLWFLQAVFTIFVVVAWLDTRGALATPRSWVIAFGVTVALNVLVRVPAGEAFFAVNGTLRLFTFFLLGVGLHRFAGDLLVRRATPVVLVAFALVYALRLRGLLTHEVLSADATRLISFLVGTFGVLGLFALRSRLSDARLARLGGYSFGIYLLHPIAASAARILAEHLGVDQPVVLFPVVLAAGLAGPVAFERTLGRNPTVSRLFLGVRRAPRPAPVPALGRAWFGRA